MTTAEDFRNGSAFFPKKGDDLTPIRIKVQLPDGSIAVTHPYLRSTIPMLKEEIAEHGGIILAILEGPEAA